MRLLCFALFTVGVLSSPLLENKATDHVATMCENMGFVKNAEGRKLLGQGHLHPKIKGTPHFRQDPASAADPKDIAGRTLKGTKMVVGICPYPPYSYEKTQGETPDPTAPDGSDWTGFSVETFELIAKKLGIKWRYLSGSYDQQVKNLENGKVDTLVTGMFLTKRIRTLYGKDWGFSGSFWSSGISVMIALRKGGNTMVAVMTNVEMWTMTAVLIMTLVASGHIFWLLERGKDDEVDEYGNTAVGSVPNSYLKGAGTGLYWASATVTTVGYGDSFPKTWKGRLWATVVMLVSLFLVGLFTGSISSAMTAAELMTSDNGIKGIKDLPGRHVAVLKGSFPDHFMTDHSTAILTRVPRMRDATKLLLDGKVDAVLGMADVLRYQIVHNPGQAKMVGFPFHQHSLVWPFPNTSPAVIAGGGPKIVAAEFSKGLLASEDSEDSDQVIQKYFADH